MVSVSFEFSVDQKVMVKPLGIEGVVSMCAIDESTNNTYFVKTQNGGEWYPERLLELAE